MKRKTTEQFIAQAKKVHGNKYDYSKAEYINNKTDVCILCPLHGEFWQRADHHLNGSGCKPCSGRFVHDTETFIQKAREKHGNKYNYSKVNYKGTQIDVCIICPKHGEFWQQPSNHLQGNGCSECKKESLHEQKLSTQEEFIQKARQVHGNKYDYSKVEYKGYDKKVIIICPKHGEFRQTPGNHIHVKKYGCHECAKIQRFETRQKNGTVNTSQPEEDLYKLLCNKFGVDDVIRQYRDETRYPFNCDFYIKSKDLFIELNANWTHQDHFYDESNPDDVARYQELLEKYPDWGWDNWTQRDPLKKKTAEENNLNYLVFWDNDLTDAIQWLDSIK